MEYVNLGRYGMKVSRLSLGAMMFGGATDEAESTRIIHRAIDDGINFIDTANGYNGGKSEEIVGKAIKGKRDKVVLVTKVSAGMGDSPNEGGLSRYHIMNEVENSLRRLRTDHIDPLTTNQNAGNSLESSLYYVRSERIYIEIRSW